MGTYLIYLRLEIKRAVKVLPRFVTGAIVLVAILGTIAFSASKLLYQDQIMSRITVGVVLPEDDKIAQKAVDMLASLDSVKSLCDFVYMKEEDGRRQLQEGVLNALMVVPEGFIKDVITGVNTPAVIILPDHPGIEEMVFKELTDSGARTLSIAQAGIYAADGLCMSYGMPDSIPEVEAVLNRVYLAYALPRADYFRDTAVSATRDVTVAQYYGISAVVMCLLFCGIPLASFCSPDKKVLRQKLATVKITESLQVLAKILSVSVLLMILSGVGLTVLISRGVIMFEVRSLGVVMLAAIVAAAVIVAIYSVSGSPTAGVIGLFWLTIGMLFLSGGLVPSAFLPVAVRKLGSFMPTAALSEILKVFAGVDISYSPLIVSAAWGLFFYMAAVIGRRRL